MSASSYTSLKCDFIGSIHSDYEGRCPNKFVFAGDAGQTRAKAKKEAGWLVAHVVNDPLRPFKVRRQDFCPEHKAYGEKL